jgi:GT2 family glycosyltransferase
MIPILGITTMTRHDLCQRLLDSIDYPINRLTLINNSGDGWQPEKPELVNEMFCLNMPSNLGTAGAWNLHIKMSPFASWWLIASDDTWFVKGSLEKIANEVDISSLNHPDVTPLWATFAIGEKVVENVGLASELFHPIYFEDNDWARRMDALNIPVKHISAKIGHDNSSTLKSGFESRNAETFNANNMLCLKRESDNVMVGGEWDLAIRRKNSWD